MQGPFRKVCNSLDDDIHVTVERRSMHQILHSNLEYKTDVLHVNIFKYSLHKFTETVLLWNSNLPLTIRGRLPVLYWNLSNRKTCYGVVRISIWFASQCGSLQQKLFYQNIRGVERLKRTVTLQNKWSDRRTTKRPATVIMALLNSVSTDESS